MFSKHAAQDKADPTAPRVLPTFRSVYSSNTAQMAGRSGRRDSPMQHFIALIQISPRTTRVANSGMVRGQKSRRPPASSRSTRGYASLFLSCAQKCKLKRQMAAKARSEGCTSRKQKIVTRHPCRTTRAKDSHKGKYKSIGEERCNCQVKDDECAPKDLKIFELRHSVGLQASSRVRLRPMQGRRVDGEVDAHAGPHGQRYNEGCRRNDITAGHGTGA